MLALLATLINASPNAVQAFAIIAVIFFAIAAIYTAIKREVSLCIVAVGLVALAIAAVCTV